MTNPSETSVDYERPKMTPGEFQVLFQVTVSELAYFKTQQWAVTNYTLLLLAGILGIAQLIRPLASFDRWLLAVLAICAAMGTIRVLSKLQHSIGRRETRREWLRKESSNTFREGWPADTKGRELLRSIHFLFSVVVFAASVIGWLVLIRL